MADRQSERVSLNGLTPEAALRALLAVDPDEVVGEDVDDDGDEAPPTTD